jgi:hypothetical protein
MSGIYCSKKLNKNKQDDICRRKDNLSVTLPYSQPPARVLTA